MSTPWASEVVLLGPSALAPTLSTDDGGPCFRNRTESSIHTLPLADAVSNMISTGTRWSESDLNLLSQHARLTQHVARLQVMVPITGHLHEMKRQGRVERDYFAEHINDVLGEFNPSDEDRSLAVKACIRPMRDESLLKNGTRSSLEFKQER